MSKSKLLSYLNTLLGKIMTQSQKPCLLHLTIVFFHASCAPNLKWTHFKLNGQAEVLMVLGTMPSQSGCS
jgi:hypothetical protein